MKKDIIEYYPNGGVKYRIRYYPNGKTKYMMRCHQNGNKQYEQFYNQQGCEHRERGLPDYQQWYDNGFILRKTYNIHGFCHNINNPGDITFTDGVKIWLKLYFLNDKFYSKLEWQNIIKNI